MSQSETITTDNDWSPVACKQTLFYFSFRSFQKHRRARSRARENERGARERNLPRFIFYHARSTDFEEKIEGL